jgi:DNA (cytosine-5)-methyltransferase 1
MQTGRGFATVVHPLEPRALSVTEALLISSFPPQFQLSGSYSERFARIGNAVPPFLVPAIARHLQQAVFDVARTPERVGTLPGNAPRCDRM